MPEIVNTSALTVDDEIAEVEGNRPVMIDVDHVSMSFNMASEQLNNLKEYAIAIARGKLFFEEFKALDDVSFKVRKGDVFGIMGTNGSGKSTILKIIAGVLEPTKGKCTVNGNIAPLIELGAGFDMDLSARENIYLNGALLGYSKQFIDDHFQEIVEFAEVEKFLDMPLKNYSSGMVARIAFAIATVIVPEILVVDEVLSVGDFMFQKKCEDRITQLIEEYGVTVLIVSHSNDQIARLCNKAVWIEKGHVRLQGDAEKVARIYGALGGREGSKESEAYIFELLKRSASLIRNDAVTLNFSANNQLELDSNIVLSAWNRFSREDVFVLSCNTTHLNSILASSVAGALKCPMFNVDNDVIPYSVISQIWKSRPNKILVFDFGTPAGEISGMLRELPWQPEVEFFYTEEEGSLSPSLKIFKYGLENDLWDNRAALMSFDDEIGSLAMTSLLYMDACPALVFNDEVDDIDKMLTTLRKSGISFLWNMLPKGCRNQTFETEFEIVDLTSNVSNTERVMEIAALVFSLFEEEVGFVDAGIRPIALSSAQWSKLLCQGVCCYLYRAPLLLFDSSDLDSQKKVLEFIESRKLVISRALFSSECGLGEIDKDLICQAFL